MWSQSKGSRNMRPTVSTEVQLMTVSFSFESVQAIPGSVSYTHSPELLRSLSYPAVKNCIFYFNTFSALFQSPLIFQRSLPQVLKEMKTPMLAIRSLTLTSGMWVSKGESEHSCEQKCSLELAQ